MLKYARKTLLTWLCVLGSSIGLSASATGQVPFGPDVRLNGATGSVTVAAGSELIVTVSLNSAQYTAYPMDWWVAASTPFGLYYLNASLAWTPASGLDDFRPLHQGGLFDLQSRVVLDSTALPAGTYTFYFGVDTLNGILDPDVIYNSAIVTIPAAVLSISANPRPVPSPTFEDQIAAWNLAYEEGTRGQTLLYMWSQLEPGNKVYETSELSSFIDNLGRFLLHLNIAVLNTTTKETPSDLKVVPFNSSQMKERFKSLIDALAPIIGSKVTYLAIGNEVDGYLSSHPDEWDAYREFYEDVAQYVRAKLPGVKVGATMTYDGATGSNADKILALNGKSDVWMFTYYPLGTNFYPIGPEAVTSALPRMVELAGGKPVVIQETGYPSSSLLKSSEQDQATFVTNVFKTWKKVGKSIAFLDFWLMHELTQDQVNELASYYGMPQSEEFKAYLGSVGLRQSDGTPKPAWQALIEEGRAMGLPDPIMWTWERHKGNPVLSNEQVPAPTGALYPVMGDPFIMLDGGTIKLWFGYGGLDDVRNEESVAVRSAYAESSDGITWKVSAPALDLGSGWDKTNAETPSVVKDDSLSDGNPRKYRMYYSGLDRAVEKLPFEELLKIGMGYGIGLAFSADGKKFTRLPASESPYGVAGLVVKPEPPKEGDNWDLIHVADPHVVVKDGTYHLWYTSLSNDGQKSYLAISYATSRDGIRWEKHGHVIKPELKWETARAAEPHLGRPYVNWTGKRFEMFYDCVGAEGEGSAGVGFAWSEDGRNWTKAGDPIFKGNGGAGERAGLMIGGNAWFVKDSTVYLIYSGYDPDLYHVVFNLASAKR